MATTVADMILGRGAGQWMKPRRKEGSEEAPAAEMYRLLWAHYLNNGLYDQLRLWGYLESNRILRSIYNPAFRAAEFYPATIWPGPLPRALPVVVADGANAELHTFIEQLWRWSNWASRKQVVVRQAAITGDCFIKVAQPADARTPRVYMQDIDPQYVTEKDTDERGYITYARIDLPIWQRDGDKRKRVTYTEIWDRERVRIWRHDKGARASLRGMGQPEEEFTLSTWGIDFVPIVHVQFLDIGAELGLGAFTTCFDKITHINLMATRLSQIAFRHNDVTWALSANAMDASGRPMPPPVVRNNGSTGGDESIEVGGERMVKLPGMSKLEPLVPSLQYADLLAIIQDMLAELEADLPEMSFYTRTKEMPEMSGRALRLLMAPAIARAHEVRGNMEGGLIRAVQMALTIGQQTGAWKEQGLGDPGDFAKGDYEFEFAERPVFELDRHDRADLAVTESGAGIPLTTSLRWSGVTEEELERMAEEKAAEQEAQQATLASAVMNSFDAMTAGGASNGLEQVA